MKSWMAERDRLLAQADALVKELNPRRPLSPAAPSIVGTTAPLKHAPAAPTPRAMSSPAALQGEADHAPLASRRPRSAEAQPTTTLPIPQLAETQREDIAIRVTRFREQQSRLGVERETFYERARADLSQRLKKDRSD